MLAVESHRPAVCAVNMATGAFRTWRHWPWIYHVATVLIAALNVASAAGGDLAIAVIASLYEIGVTAFCVNICK